MEQPGLTIPPLKKLGYKGVESTELVFDGFARQRPACSAARRASARASSTSWARSSSAASTSRSRRRRRHARSRKPSATRRSARRSASRSPSTRPFSSSSPRWRRRSRRACSRCRPPSARKTGDQADLEAGMAKLFATETAAEVSLEAMRIHGGTATRRSSSSSASTATPVLILGEGSNEIQQLVIAQAPRAPRARLMDFAVPDELSEIRAAVRALCEEYPGGYWRGLEPTATPRSSSPH